MFCNFCQKFLKSSLASSTLWSQNPSKMFSNNSLKRWPLSHLAYEIAWIFSQWHNKSRKAWHWFLKRKHQKLFKGSCCSAFPLFAASRAKLFEIIVEFNNFLIVSKSLASLRCNNCITRDDDNSLSFWHLFFLRHYETQQRQKHF